MSMLWLKWILIAACGWIVVACVTSGILGLVINYGKRQEALARWRQAISGYGQKLPARERAPVNEPRPSPDIDAVGESQDAEHLY